MTGQTAREEELVLAMRSEGERLDPIEEWERVLARALLPIIARIEAEALARGRMEGAAQIKAAGDQLAQVAEHACECYFEYPYACYCGLEAAIEQWRSITNPAIQQENQHE